MTDLPYVAGAYGLALALAGMLSISATLRLRRARRRLAAVGRARGR